MKSKLHIETAAAFKDKLKEFDMHAPSLYTHEIGSKLYHIEKSLTRLYDNHCLSVKDFTRLYDMILDRQEKHVFAK